MSNLSKRLARLEGDVGGLGFLPIIALDDLVLGDDDTPSRGIPVRARQLAL